MQGEAATLPPNHKGLSSGVQNQSPVFVLAQGGHHGDVLQRGERGNHGRKSGGLAGKECHQTLPLKDGRKERDYSHVHGRPLDPLLLRSQKADVIPGDHKFCCLCHASYQVHTCGLQRALRSVYKNPHDLNRHVVLGSETRVKLQFLQRLQKQATPLRLPDPDVVMATRVLKVGWGASLHAWSARGQWPRSDWDTHINNLEFKAVFNELKAFQNKLRDKMVATQVANTTVVAYLSKEGATKLDHLSLLTKKMLLWCQERNITLRAVYVKGIVNMVADDLL